MNPPRCYLRYLAGCEGPLIRAHLIPKQLLKRHGLDPDNPATWVPCCGGLSGLGGHHGQLDAGRIRLSRDGLPEQVEAFADTHGLGWYLDRRYGPLEAVA